MANAGQVKLLHQVHGTCNSCPSLAYDVWNRSTNADLSITSAEGIHFTFVKRHVYVWGIYVTLFHAAIIHLTLLVC
jgi:hypothetical protein